LPSPCRAARCGARCAGDRRIADIKRLWRFCSPTCRRARRCALNGPDACVVVYQKEFEQIMREQFAPQFRKKMQEGAALYDPDPDDELPLPEGRR
jgi:hypothetical protein